MLHKATLISRDLKNGWDFIRDEVPLGKIYYVDLNKITELTFGRVDPVPQTIRLSCVLAFDTPEGGACGYHGYLPLEVLKIEANA